jgi:hypothetical protein
MEVIILETKIITEVVNPPPFKEPEVLLSYSQESAIGSCLAPDKSTPHPYTVFSEDATSYYSLVCDYTSQLSPFIQISR